MLLTNPQRDDVGADSIGCHSAGRQRLLSVSFVDQGARLPQAVRRCGSGESAAPRPDQSVLTFLLNQLSALEKNLILFFWRSRPTRSDRAQGDVDAGAGALARHEA
jgi:hypothetical protein